jgi:hypothetical protein
MTLIQELKRLRQEDHVFKASLAYVVRACLKKKNHTDSGWALNPMTGNFIRSGEENREAQERRQCKNGNRN